IGMERHAEQAAFAAGEHQVEARVAAGARTEVEERGGERDAVPADADAPALLDDEQPLRVAVAWRRAHVQRPRESAREQLRRDRRRLCRRRRGGGNCRQKGEQTRERAHPTAYPIRAPRAAGPLHPLPWLAWRRAGWARSGARRSIAVVVKNVLA